MSMRDVSRPTVQSGDVCWWCRGRLIWGGDHDISEEEEFFDMSTNLTCSDCGAHVIYYRLKEEEVEIC